MPRPLPLRHLGIGVLDLLISGVHRVHRGEPTPPLLVLVRRPEGAYRRALLDTSRAVSLRPVPDGPDRFGILAPESRLRVGTYREEIANRCPWGP